MSKVNGTIYRLRVNGEIITHERRFYFTTDKIYVQSIVDDTEEKDFNYWAKKRGELFTLSIDSDTLKATDKMILTRVGILAQVNDVVTMTLVFKR